MEKPVEKVASLEKPVGKAKDPIGDNVDDEEEVDVAHILMYQSSILMWRVAMEKVYNVVHFAF